MGGELRVAYPVFAAAFDAACAALDPHLDRPLREVLTGTTAPSCSIGPDGPQPALFAFRVGLPPSSRGASCPITSPGHSIGELTAAHVAGVLSLARRRHPGRSPAGG